jgi:ribosomal protein S18 acetylase RimI-like enzyme
MTVTTRPEERGADEPFLRGLILQNLTLELHADQWPQPMRDHLLGIQYQGRRSSAPSSYPEGASRIILMDGAPAGWIYIADLDDAVYIAEILVLAEHRGKGVGSAVMRGIMDTAGEKTVRLSVNTLNSGAVRFYERLGFRRVRGGDVDQVMEYRR